MIDKPFSFNKEELKSFEELKKEFPNNGERSLILPTLWMIQKKQGYIPSHALSYVAQLIGVPDIWVEEVVSWYSMFSTQKRGKYHIQVCRNLSCSLRGAEELIGYVQQKLGIAPGEMNEEKQCSFSTVECLASCGSAPMMQINEDYYENLTKKKIDEIFATLK